MTLHLTTRELTVPEALMAFLHASNGRPYETAKPGALTAAAELAELLTDGQVRLDGERLVVDAPVSSDRPWVREATDRLAAEPADVATWVRQRKDALATQQAAAAAQGILVQGRSRLFGLVPYDTNTVDPGVREGLLAHLTGPDAPSDPRAVVLARLLVTARLHLRGGISRAQGARLAELAQLAPANTPAPAAISALDMAMVTVVYTTVISE